MTTSDHLRPALDPTRLPPGIEIVEVAASTNALVAERAQAGASAGLVIAAEHQTAGRGRLDRSWEVPPRAALTFSMLLRPEMPPADWPWIPLLVGYAVHAALVDRVESLGLKWPNDLLVETPEGDRKIGGILVERVETPDGPAAVVGIGINVLQAPGELPVPEAISLVQLVEGTPDRTELLGSVIGSIDALMPLLREPDTLRAAYAGDCVTLGREVEVTIPGGAAVVGTAVDIDPGGRLVVATGSGEVAVGAGDVVHVRPVVGGL